VRAVIRAIIGLCPGFVRVIQAHRSILVKKYSALGNRYWVLPFEDSIQGGDVVRLCSGAASDGVLIGARVCENFSLRIFNADGSEAKISGNGTRIFAAHLARLGHVATGTAFPIMTPHGNVLCTVHRFTGQNYDVSADLEICSCETAYTWHLDGKTPLMGYRVDLGNPHFILSPDDSRAHATLLKHVAQSPNWVPTAANVHLLQMVDARNIFVRSWERGVGPTASCGSGACGCAFVAHHFYGYRAAIGVHMPGGDLGVKVFGRRVTIRGPIKFEQGM
jgi:diaminopimelate epimerase